MWPKNIAPLPLANQPHGLSLGGWLFWEVGNPWQLAAVIQWRLHWILSAKHRISWQCITNQRPETPQEKRHSVTARNKRSLS